MFDHGHHLVHGKILPNVDATANPTDFEAVDAAVPSQAKMQPRAPMALVAATAVDLVDQPQITRRYLYARPDSVPVCLNPAQTQLQPVWVPSPMMAPNFFKSVLYLLLSVMMIIFRFIK